MRIAVGNRRVGAVLKISLPIGLFLVSPYIINNNFVFIFLIPLLTVLCSEDLPTVLRLALPAVLVSVLAALLPVLVTKPAAYFVGSAVAFAFLAAFSIIVLILLRNFRGPALSFLIPAVVWLNLLYALNINSTVSAMFDVGVLFPVSAPLIWFTGSIGLTALIVLFQSAVALYIARRSWTALILACALAAVFLGAFIFSSLQPYAAPAGNGPATRIALIQGGLPNRTFFGYKDNFNKRVERYVGLSLRACRAGADLVVWPEYAFPVDVMKRFPQQAQSVLDAARACGKEFLIGSMLDSPDGAPAGYDGAIIIGKDGSVAEAYYSSHPFTIGNAVRPSGASARLMADGAGVTVCWEEANERIFRDYVNAGAGYFISLSSNIDLDRSWLKGYASFFSRARAAENARYLARAAQTGTTFIADPFGRITARAPNDASVFLAGDIYKVRMKTFYSIRGDILARAFAAAGILVLCVLTVLRLIASRREVLYGSR